MNITVRLPMRTSQRKAEKLDEVKKLRNLRM